MGKKLPTRLTIILFLISFAGFLAWAVENTYYNTYLFNNIYGDTFVVSLMVAISAVMSTVTTIVMGAVSDVTGKRKPFILYGFIFWGITTALFPFAAELKPVLIAVAVAILIDCIMTFFGATLYDACFNAYVVDVTTIENRGSAVSIQVSMIMFSTLVVYATAAPLTKAFGDYGFYLIIGALTGIIGVIGALLMKDSPTLKPLNTTVWKHIRTSFSMKTLRENPDCFLVLMSIGIWAIGFNIFFSFILIYAQHTIGLDPFAASMVLFISLLASVIVGFPLGRLVDKVGRKKIGIISLIGCSIGVVLFGLARNMVTLIITGIIWVCFMAGWRIVYSTWSKDLFPKDKLAQFNGFFLIANVLVGMVFGSPLGGWLGREYGQTILFEGKEIIAPSAIIYFVGAVFILLAIIPLIKAKEAKRTE